MSDPPETPTGADVASALLVLASTCETVKQAFEYMARSFVHDLYGDVQLRALVMSRADFERQYARQRSHKQRRVRRRR